MAFPENTVNDIGIKHIWDKVVAALSGKVDKVSGKGLSTNDYTTAEKTKLEGIEAGAQVNTVTSVAGKTGAVTLDKSDVGLGNVDNTSDASKPISTATQNALDGKADNSDVTETDTTNSTPFLYRETLYEADRVFLDELVGGSVAWNQLVQNGDFSDTSGWQARNSSTISVNSNVCTVTPGSANSLNIVSFPSPVKYRAGHKILVNVNVKSSASIRITMQNNGVRFSKYSSASGNWKSVCGIYNSVENEEVLCFTNTTDTNAYDIKNVYICDLTQMFGTVIADYVYSLEQATAGSGIAWLKSHGFFTKDYYPYNAGELISVKTSGKKYVGKNVLDYSKYEENGTFCVFGGPLNSNDPNGNVVVPAGTWTFSVSSVVELISVRKSASEELVRLTNVSSAIFTVTETTAIKLSIKQTNFVYSNYTYQLEKGSTATPYEPHTETTYDISNIDLRGIPKLVNNELAYDGDIYDSDGDVTKKYGIVDFGNANYEYVSVLAQDGIFPIVISDRKSNVNVISAFNIDVAANWDDIPNKSIRVVNYEQNMRVRFDGCTTVDQIKAAMSGVYLVYELATPTTETTDPFTNPQICDKDGTEEWIDDRTVPIPVGHNSTYANLPSMMDGRYLNYMVDNFATKEYTDRAVERVAPKATLIDTWMISEESDTISVDLTSYDCNFFLLEYLFNSKRGTTLIPRPQGGSFSASVVTYNNGSALYIELTYNPTTKELAYTSNITSQFGILAIYTI